MQTKEEFLEEAIRNAHEEAMEEISVLLEGGDTETVAKTLTSILSDLLHSAEHFHEHREFLKGEIATEFRFQLGDFVKGAVILSPVTEMIEAANASRFHPISGITRFKQSKKSEVVGQFADPYNPEKECYILQQNGSYFLATGSELYVVE